MKKINFFQLILDLLIVFIGVSLAFLASNYQEEKKQEKKVQQILSLLDIGLGQYEQLFQGFMTYHQKHNAIFLETLNKHTIPNFDGVTFPAPAYPIDAVILLTDEGYEVLNPEIYVALTAFSNGMQRLSYVEQKLVHISEKSMDIIAGDFSTTRSHYYEQEKWAKLYLRYLNIRKNILKELLDKSHNLRILLKHSYTQEVFEWNRPKK